MQTFISILRGINVSGQKKILMTDLKSLYESLHFREVVTYIQSGNVIFKSEEKLSGPELATKIEQVIYKKYNFHVPVIIRSVEELEKIISTNPFLREKNINIDRLHVTFLSELVSKSHSKSIENFDATPDRFILKEKEIFLYIPESYGATKLSNNFFEKKLKVTATTRNWKTVNKLFEIASGK